MKGQWFWPAVWREDGRWFVLLCDGCFGGSRDLLGALQNALSLRRTLREVLAEKAAGKS
jgi:hypothetical protein